MIRYHARVHGNGGGNDLISVLIRTRNRPKLLGEALDSVATQSYGHVEAVVVNDGGPPVDEVLADRTGELRIIAERFEESRGRVAAVNRALELANGRWVAVLDDDDLFRPDALQVLADAAEGNAVVYGRVQAWLYEGKAPKLYKIFGRPFDAELLLFENYIPIIGCLIPREELINAGGFDPELDCFEDWELFLRLVDRLSFRFVDHEVAEYRLFGGGFITGKGGQARQHRGRTQLYERHWDRFSPEVLSRIQWLVKTEVVRAEAEALAPEREARLAALDEGVRFLREALAAARAESLPLRRRASELEAELRALQEWVAGLGSYPGVSVVIVNFNGREHLERCLPALEKTNSVPVETIVVDNASTDGSVEWLRSEWPGVRVLAQDENLGFGAANRIGVEAASHEYVALLNSDTEVEPQWLVPLVDALRNHPDVGAVCSTLRLLERPEILNAEGGGMSKLGLGFDHRFGEPYRPWTGEREVLFPTAAAMLLRRRDFLALGGFEPAFFMYHEDVDLGWRIWLSGLRVLVSGDSVVRHLFGGTTRSQQSMGWRERLGMRHDLRSLLVCYGPYNLLRALKGLGRLWWSQRAFGTALHVVLWNAVRLRGTLRRRRGVQKSRRITDDKLFGSGLISEGPYPAPQPELPRGAGRRDAERWLETPTLLPGHSSALGRLGWGWYGREPVGGDWARPTCGQARCWLSVEPRKSGTLTVTFHAPPEACADGRELEVRCNGYVTRAELDGSLWQEAELWVTADDEGLLEVDLLTEPWVPHELTGNWDFRRLGCAVRRLAFDDRDRQTVSDEPLVSVVIPTFNRWPVLERTLEALARQTWEPLEVIVVDDGSTDETPERLLAWRDENADRLVLTALRQENAGQGIARNLGLRHAAGELVVILGDDIVPDPGLVEAHVDRHREVGEPCGVVGFTDWDRKRVRVTSALEAANEDGQQFGYAHMEDGDDIPYTCFYTSNISLPREVLGEQPFDPSFRVYGWEDVELGYRLSLRGLRLIYCEGARARHEHPMTFRSFHRRQIRVGESLGTLLEAHPELERDDVMPPARPPTTVSLLRPLMPLAVPVVDMVDRIGVRLPRRLLRDLFLAGFLEGRRRDASRRRVSAGG